MQRSANRACRLDGRQAPRARRRGEQALGTIAGFRLNLIWLKCARGGNASMAVRVAHACTMSIRATNDRLIEGMIANLPMFRQAARAQLAQLARHSHTREVRRGEAVCRRGDRLEGLFAVAYGLVKLALKGESGEEKVVRLVGPGETFGEAVVFLERPCPVDAVALADTMVVVVPATSLFSLIDHDPRFARALIASLSQRMHALVADVEAGALRSGSQRIAAFLDSLAEPGLSQPKVRLPATKTVIAARLGMTKETFSRLLRELADRGLVSVAKREVVLLDREQLAAVAAGDSRDATRPLERASGGGSGV
jgi:CRP-like cAMP-binding protein